MARLHAAVLGVVACLAEAATLQESSTLGEAASTEVASAIAVLSDTLLDADAPDHNVHQAMNAIAGKMDIKSAAKIIEQGKLPSDVASLVQTLSDGDSGTTTQFDEASMEKARIALNSLVEKAWAELDNKIFKCKGFQDMNRNNYGQVTRDIMRLIEQINDLERLESEAIEGIAQT